MHIFQLIPIKISFKNKLENWFKDKPGAVGDND